VPETVQFLAFSTRRAGERGAFESRACKKGGKKAMSVTAGNAISTANEASKIRGAYFGKVAGDGGKGAGKGISDDVRRRLRRAA
jgi:hypothetical protein